MDTSIEAWLLDALFPDVGIASFLHAVYPFEPLVSARSRPHPAVDAAREVGTAHEILARARDLPVLAYRPTAHGAAQQVVVDAVQARREYESGATLSIEAGEIVHPPLAECNRRLHDEIGLTVRTEPALSLSPAGARVPLHCDGVELLVVQLSGAKLWSMAPTARPRCVDFTHFPSEAGPGVRGGRGPREMDRDIVDEPPAERRQFLLEPGGVLFLPRGFWHETESRGESVNAVFRLKTPTAAALVAQAIERQLRTVPVWRTPIQCAGGSAILKALGARTLAPLLARLRGDLDLDSASDVANVLSGGRS